jgi:hypothetical protein
MSWRSDRSVSATSRDSPLSSSSLIRPRIARSVGVSPYAKFSSVGASSSHAISSTIERASSRPALPISCA